LATRSCSLNLLMMCGRTCPRRAPRGYSPRGLLAPRGLFAARVTRASRVIRRAGYSRLAGYSPRGLLAPRGLFAARGAGASPPLSGVWGGCAWGVAHVVLRRELLDERDELEQAPARPRRRAQRPARRAGAAHVSDVSQRGALTCRRRLRSFAARGAGASPPLSGVWGDCVWGAFTCRRCLRTKT
jgi:hypothetical protein